MSLSQLQRIRVQPSPERHFGAWFFQAFAGLSCLGLMIGIGAPAAIAFPKQFASTIEAVGEQQPYDALVRSAEAQAQRVLENAFAREPGLTEATVTVLGRRNNQEVPLIVATVSRTNWRRSPNVRSWARYTGYSAKVLLGYVQPVPSSPPAAPPAATVPTAPPAVPGSTTIVSPIPVAPTQAPPQTPPAPVTSEPSSPSPRSIEEDPGFRDD